MDRAALADELPRARFRTTQFREGYAQADVDALLGR
ncbi:DivIVA domain-containing protein [Terrabacter lapilli]|nr:DivIVA domain-containing protein [Terrabacter sp.]